MKKKKRRKNTIFKNWDNYKRYNMHIVGKAGVEGEKGREEIFEAIMNEIFPR